MKIGLVASVKLSHPYLKNDPAPPLDFHHLRISPWLWFSSTRSGKASEFRMGVASKPARENRRNRRSRGLRPPFTRDGPVDIHRPSFPGKRGYLAPRN